MTELFTVRGRILKELHRRLDVDDLLAEISNQSEPVVVAVAAAVEIDVKPGEVVLAILPGEDSPWDDGQYQPGIYREWEIVVQVGRARGGRPDVDETKNTLEAWLSLEKVLDKVIAAVEKPVDPDADPPPDPPDPLRAPDAPDDGECDPGGEITGLILALDRLSIEPSEQPVGGVAVGLDVTWRLRYAAVPECLSAEPEST